MQKVTELGQESIVSSADADTIDATLAASGDAQAFERLYRGHVDRIYGLACRMVGRDEAEELAQDVFVRAWEKLGTFRGDARFGTWLHRLAINVMLGHRQAAGRARSRFIDAEQPMQSVRAPSGHAEFNVDFDAAVEQLPRGARQVFVLHDVEGFKHREVAGMLGVTVGTSKAQLHRARMTLRRFLKS